MADHDFLPDVQKYAADADADAVAGIVKHLQFSQMNPQADAALVSCSDPEELARVRESWLKKKLARSEGDGDLDAAIEAVCGTMAGDNRKSRVAFYYLLAKNYGALDSVK